MFAPGDLGISSITAGELFVGAVKSSDPVVNLAALDKLLLPLEIASFDFDAAKSYGAIRAHLEGRGEPIGALDTLIAAQALSLGVVLVTNNTGEFSRIPGLIVEDWT
jgi:tRNA(fMet)-specific endonuclease VapC